MRVSSKSPFSNAYSVEIGKNVEKIYSYIFLGNNNLTEIELPDNISQISDKVFYNCASLTKIKLPFFKPFNYMHICLR